MITGDIRNQIDRIWDAFWSGGISNPNTNTAYDRDAMRAQLLVLREHELVTKIFFNDQTLIGEGLCARLGGHNNHVHFEIGAPEALPAFV